MSETASDDEGAAFEASALGAAMLALDDDSDDENVHISTAKRLRFAAGACG